jgi:hypothetical protein
MCQVNGPSAWVGCSKCGAGFYENSRHVCKKYISFEKWDAELQRDAKVKYKGKNSLLATLQRAVKNVASWPEWKRRYVWAEEFQYSIGRPKCV